jgi:hypothetical protein
MAPAKKTAAAAAETEPVKKPATRRRRKPTVTHEMIETRAYMISLVDEGGTPLDHWLAAERELMAA